RQMRLTYTDAAFTYNGVTMPGVPVILNDDMTIAESPQRWLFYIALERGRTRSRETWRSYAEALYDWLQTGTLASAWGGRSAAQLTGRHRAGGIKSELRATIQ